MFFLKILRHFVVTEIRRDENRQEHSLVEVPDNIPETKKKSSARKAWRNWLLNLEFSNGSSNETKPKCDCFLDFARLKCTLNVQ